MKTTARSAGSSLLFSRGRTLCLFLFALLSLQLQAQETREFQLGSLFQDHMVLQRDQPIRIWGTAAPGSKVRVEMNGKKSSATAGKNGEWTAVLTALSKKGPYVIQVSSGSRKLELQDVLLGDVWIASGQSNMEWPVNATNYRETDSSWMASAEVRLIKIRPETDYQPRKESINNGWKTLSPEEMGNFSAVAYHFGKRLHKETGVPIGLISANLGATAIETWMSNEALAQFPQFPAQPAKSFQQMREEFKDGSAAWSEEEYYSGPGFQQKWYAESASEGWKPLEVAGNTWETVEELKDFDGAVWFRKRFDLPENFKGDSLNLQLLQIDDHDITWVNGKKVAESFGKHNHRNYKLARKDLQEKDNLLVVRVFDAGGIGGFTTNAFWGNEILWGTWEYRKGKEIQASAFQSPQLPNITPFSSPGVLYNGTVAPLTALGVKGVLWYQGESNELRAHEYRSLFPALIRDWRKQFNRPELPFLFVQLANYREEPVTPGASLWAELREAQSQALQLPNTGMAVAIDLGEAADIHPRNKEDVGKRLAGLALEMVYDQEPEARSPQFKEMQIEAGKAVISLQNIGEGMANRNKYGYIRGFAIAGADKQFHWAMAELRGNKLLVWSSQVKEPVAVRYAWSDNPGPLDLYNSAGLPLAPFRTDDWKLETEGEVFQEGPRF